ncbi:hypothetical protein RJ639_012581 [Escallonia herrerae]|uniref:Uncharacterized protein n=1 Tax=Escallonia herrerae TaxID=1293975 RepID=A0AA88VPT0_9ASTE|nr:hypothetical protein RJ639_012581 [Escallonia herrerae]
MYANMALPNQQTLDYPSFKLVTVGDGKTTFIKRHLTGEFEKKTSNLDRPISSFVSKLKKFTCESQTATIGVEVHPLDFFTNCGRIRFIAGTQLGRRNLMALGMVTSISEKTTLNLLQD